MIPVSIEMNKGYSARATITGALTIIREASKDD